MIKVWAATYEWRNEPPSSAQCRELLD